MTDLSIATYGARPGIPGAAATRVALERCVEASAASGVVRPIVVPADPAGYWVDRPVTLAPAKGGDAEYFVRGEAPGTVLAGSGSFPPLVLGLRQSPADGAGKAQVWDASHYVDAFGVLDASAAPRPGVRWGLRTANDTVYGFPASPLSHGPVTEGGWPSVRALTVDVAYRVQAGGRRPGPDIGGVQLLGVAPKGVPRPSYVYLAPVDGGGYEHAVVFGTADGDRVAVHVARVPIEPGPVWPEKGPGPLRRLSFEIALDAGEVRAWAGGRRVPVALSGAALTPGLRLVDNDVTPFKLGGLGDDLTGWADNFGGPVDVTFFGLRLGTERRYADGPVGSAQAAADGTPADDGFRFFAERHGSTLGFLPLTDPPGRSRWVACQAGLPDWSLTYGFATLAGWHGAPANAGSSVRLQDLDLRGGGYYGAALWVGGSISGGFQSERCRLTGGYYGAGGLLTCVAYPVLWRDCTFRGLAGDGYFGNGQTVLFEGLTTVLYPARNGIRLRSCGASFAQLSMLGDAGPRCETFVRMDGGGSLILRNFMLDQEYFPTPTLAGVLAERGPDTPGARLVLDEGGMDGVAPDAPLVWLRDAAPPGHPSYRPATVRVRGLGHAQGDRPGPTVRTDGPGWSGVIEDTEGARVEDSKLYGPGKVRAED